jgi:hypothetical protein
MELQTSTNGSKQSQKSTTITEQITFITDDEAKEKMSRLYIPDKVYQTFIRAFDRLEEGRDEWCHVTTDDYAFTKKTALYVAKKAKVALVVQKSHDGLMFRLATDDEVEKRKEKGQELVNKRREKKEKK